MAHSAPVSTGYGTGFPTGSRLGARIAGLAAVSWAVLSLARVPLTGEADLPAWTASPDTVVAFYEGLRFDAALIVGMGMVTIGWVLLLLFVAKVADLLTGLDRGSRWLTYALLGGAVVEIGLTMAYLAAFTTAAFWSSQGGPVADGSLLLHGLVWAPIRMAAIVQSLWLSVFAFGIVRTGLFPRWLGWAILLHVAVQLAGFFVELPLPVQLVLGGLAYLWLFIAGLLMLIRPGRYSEAVP